MTSEIIRFGFVILWALGVSLLAAIAIGARIRAGRRSWEPTGCGCPYDCEKAGR